MFVKSLYIVATSAIGFVVGDYCRAIILVENDGDIVFPFFGVGKNIPLKNHKINIF